MITSISAPSNQISDTQVIPNPLASGTTDENKFSAVLEKLAASQMKDKNNKANPDPEDKAEKNGKEKTDTAAKDYPGSLKTDSLGLAEEIPAWAAEDGAAPLKQKEDKTAADFNSFILPAVICQSMADQKTDLVADSETISSPVYRAGTKTAEKVAKTISDFAEPMPQTAQQTGLPTVPNNIAEPFVSGVSKEELLISGGQVCRSDLGSDASPINGQKEKVLPKEPVVSQISQSLSEQSRILPNEIVLPAPSAKQDTLFFYSIDEMMPEGNKLFEKTLIETAAIKSIVQGNRQASVDRQRDFGETPKATVMADVLSASLKATEKNGLKITETSGKSIDQTTAANIFPEGAAADNTNSFKVTVNIGGNSNTADTADTLSDKRTSSSEPAAQEQTPAEKDSPNSMPQELWGLTKAEMTVGRTVSAEKASNISQPEAYQQIYDRISDVIKDNDSASLRMKLYPEGLGEIAVTVNCQDNKLSLEIVADNPLTQKLLQGQAEELKAALMTKNYEVPSLCVSAKSETAFAFTATEDAPFSFFERNAGNGQYGENERYADYELSGDYLSGEESFIETSQQNIYYGSFNSWA